MKTIILSLLLVWATAQMEAQSPPCSMDNCFTPTPWTYNTLTDSLCCTCSVCHYTVEYWCRVCNGVLQVQMGNFTTSGTCTDTCLTSLWAMAFHSVLAKNSCLASMLAGLGDDDCITGIQARSVTCYKLIRDSANPTNPFYRSVYCDTNGCCAWEYKVCKVHGVIQPPEFTSSPSSNLNCALYDTNCRNTCVYVLPKSSYEDRIPVQGETIEIAPIPTDGLVTISIQTGNRGTYEFVVSDAKGSIVRREKLEVSHTVSSHSVSLANCARGVYYYTLRKDGMTYRAGTIVVVPK